MALLLKKSIVYVQFCIKTSFIHIFCVVCDSSVFDQQKTIDTNMSRRKEMFYLMMRSTHFIYSYMTSDIYIL